MSNCSFCKLLVLCSETTTLGDYTIEAGTYVQADVFSVHFDEQIWGPDVMEFKPERWLEEYEEKPSMSWMGSVLAHDYVWECV